MMAELLIAGRSLTGSMRSHGGGGYHKASSPGSAAVAGSSYPAGLPGQWEDRYKEKRSIPQPVIPNTAVSETCSTSHP